MTNSFSELVSDYLQDIAYALRHPQAAGPARSVSVERFESERREELAPAGAPAVLPPANIDHLVGGSYFLEDEASEAQGYHVFARQNAQTPFRYRTTLETMDDLPRFVESAYLSIIERPADDAGRGNYVMMLREGYLRPIEFLKSLAACDEFLHRPTRIVVVPQSSQWLSRLSTSVNSLEIRTAMDL